MDITVKKKTWTLSTKNQMQGHADQIVTEKSNTEKIGENTRIKKNIVVKQGNGKLKNFVETSIQNIGIR